MTINWEPIAIALLAIGMIATWTRNGKHAAKNYGSLETTVKETNKKLDTVIEKQVGMAGEQQEMRVRCAEISSAYGQKIKGLEGEVFNNHCDDR